MPKGRVPERECVCKACGVTFRTDMPGKASWFCGTPECDAARGVKARKPYVPLAQRDPGAAAARAAETQRQRQQRADAKRRRTAEREAALEQARQDRDREHRVGVAQRTAERLVPRVVKAREHAAGLLGELRDHVAVVRELGGDVPAAVADLARLPAAAVASPSARTTARATGPAPPPHTSPPAGDAAAPASAPTGPLADRLAQLHQDVVAFRGRVTERFGDDAPTFRQFTARGMRQVGTARGAGPTADALYRLAVVALAWEAHLRVSAREVRQQQSDAA